MTKTFYIQTEKDTNKITDVIEYAHEGYSETQLETPLPPKIMAGCYKLIAGSTVYVPEWDIELQALETRTSLLESAVEEIALGGM